MTLLSKRKQLEQSDAEARAWIELFEWIQEQGLDVGQVYQAVRDFRHGLVEKKTVENNSSQIESVGDC